MGLPSGTNTTAETPSPDHDRNDKKYSDHCQVPSCKRADERDGCDGGGVGGDWRGKYTRSLDEGEGLDSDGAGRVAALLAARASRT